MMFGCFQAKGASIGDVYLASETSFHDRRIPLPVCFLMFLFPPICVNFMSNHWENQSG